MQTADLLDFIFLLLEEVEELLLASLQDLE